MTHFQRIHAVRTAAFFCAALAFAPIARSSSVAVEECTAYAGSITTDSTQQCLVNGSATLVAVPGGDAVIPPGYQIGYILTSTNGPGTTATMRSVWSGSVMLETPQFSSSLNMATIGDGKQFLWRFKNKATGHCQSW